MGKKILIFLIAILLIIGIIFGICKIKEKIFDFYQISFLFEKSAKKVDEIYLTFIIFINIIQ